MYPVRVLLLPTNPTGYIFLWRNFGLTTPRKFYVDIWDSKAKKRLTFFSDRQGRAFDSYGIALETLEKMNDDIKANRFDPANYRPEDLKKWELLNKWEDYKNQPDLSKGYFKALRKTEKYIFEYFKKEQDIREIQQTDVAGYLRVLMTTFKYETARQYLRYFVACVNSYSDINNNKTFSVPKQARQEKRARAEKEEAIIPEMNEVFKVISFIPAEHQLYYWFNSLHVCRICEGRAVQSGDFNFTNNTVRIQRHFDVDELKAGSKTGNKYDIPIHKALIEVLRNRCVALNPTEFVFAHTFKKEQRPFSHAWLGAMWKKAAIAAGLPHVKFYKAMSHAGSSEMANISGNLFGVSKLKGHYGSTSNTLKYTKRRDMEVLRDIQSTIVVPEGAVETTGESK